MHDPFQSTRAALRGTIFENILYKAQTDSTNADALELLEQPERNCGITIVTDFQYQGRGRRGRQWVAVPGSALLFTTILPVSLDAASLWAVPFWCALAIKDALAQHHVQSTLQWPNDVLLTGKKVAGILCVSRGTGARAWAACGVGINVNRVSDDAYADIEPAPAFVSDVTPTDRVALLTRILRQFDASLKYLENPSGVARHWEAAANLNGTPYRILIDGESEPIDAVAQRLGPQGGLVVRVNGAEREISFAEARVLR
ncbi:MAG: biotin--[acetyl-CoA-carboxylase] ligase [Candidatus Eremiobacteraeota bacterium]|nr:biotin--[acetyl-CoA-carboxylase] ligase [Candidatus Eremiobacteraeota bacterium]